MRGANPSLFFSQISAISVTSPIGYTWPLPGAIHGGTENPKTVTLVNFAQKNVKKDQKVFDDQRAAVYNKDTRYE